MGCKVARKTQSDTIEYPTVNEENSCLKLKGVDIQNCKVDFPAILCQSTWTVVALHHFNIQQLVPRVGQGIYICNISIYMYIYTLEMRYRHLNQSMHYDTSICLWIFWGPPIHSIFCKHKGWCNAWAIFTIRASRSGFGTCGMLNVHFTEGCCWSCALKWKAKPRDEW